MNLLIKLKLLFRFVAVYFWELTESNLHVTYDVIVPKEYYKPGIIILHVDLTSDYQAVLLANLITMTPGTICIDYRSEQKELEIHLMYMSQQNTIARRIQQVYVPFVREIVP